MRLSQIRKVVRIATGNRAEVDEAFSRRLLLHMRQGDLGNATNVFRAWWRHHNPPARDLMGAPLWDTWLGDRDYGLVRVLEGHGVKTNGDLAALTPARLTAIPHVGSMRRALLEAYLLDLRSRLSRES
jgi:hypothetical protein